MKKLRMSSLPSVTTCPGLWVLRQSGRDSPGSAAQTGSATGRVVQLLHENGRRIDSALQQALVVEAEQWPLADPEQVEAWGRAYAMDPRHWDGSFVQGSCEREVVLTLDPAPEDPTGRPIELKGHLDQLRRDNTGRLRVWDLKTGRGTGPRMLCEYALQLAAYSVAAEETLGEPCWPGGIIRARAYDTVEGKTYPHRAKAFWHAPWDNQRARAMLGTIRLHVAWLRLGIVHLQPGAHCLYCPAEGMQCLDETYPIPSPDL